MPSESVDLVNALAARGITVVGAIVKDSSEGGALFVRIAIERDEENLQQPTNRQLASLKDELLASGQRVEFLLTDEHGLDIEGGLRATLMHAFGAEIRNVFLSLNGHVGHVWLEPKRTLDEVAIHAIEARVKTFLEGLGISLGTIATVGDERVPGNLACLRVLRKIAPATLAEIKSELERRQFTVPSDDWLRRRVDILRKSGKVVWLAGGRFSCTLETLRNLGTVKGRGSPDIERLLALSRQGR